jgi:hypothetical protein
MATAQPNKQQTVPQQPAAQPAPQPAATAPVVQPVAAQPVVAEVTHAYTGQTPAEVIKKFGGISQAIRGLNAEGFSRSQIAKILDKRYQHVRNVLITPVTNPGRQGNTTTVAQPAAAQPAAAETPQQPAVATK